MRVWIDQDLCTGDGLCTDHCPEVFVLLEDGISYVRDENGNVGNDPGGRISVVAVRPKLVDAVIAAALDCPGDCIFLETEDGTEADDSDVLEGDLVSTPASPVSPVTPT